MQRRRNLWGAALLAAGLALPPFSLSAQAIAAVDQPLQSVLQANGSSIPLDLPTGSYVAGQFEPQASAELVLSLQSDDGTPPRELLRAADGQHDFHLIAPAGARFVVQGPEGASFRLTLESIVPPQEQQRAEPADQDSTLLSPTLAAIAPSADTSPFWAERRSLGTPMIEPGPGGQQIVTFLFQGARRNVRLLGGPGPDHDWLARLGQTDIWYRSYLLPNDTRLAYKLAPDIPDLPGPARARRVALLATAAADPLNPQRWPEKATDAFNQWSVLELPDAPEQPGFPAPSLPVTEMRLTSALLGNTRRVQMFATAGFDPTDAKALLLFVFDGPRAVDQMQIPGALQNLVTAGRLPPIAVMFIDPIDGATRSAELPGNPDFARFMAQEALPFAAQHFGLTPDPARTILAGASYGGIGATHVALAAPDQFGAVISMSGSYWWAPDDWPKGDLGWMAERVLAADTLPRFVLTAGLFEGGRLDNGIVGMDIRETSRQLHGILQARDAESHWQLYAAGHDSFVWRGALTQGLLTLYPQP